MYSEVDRTISRGREIIVFELRPEHMRSDSYVIQADSAEGREHEISIRDMNLAAEISRQPDYFSAVVARASRIFDTVFSDSTSLAVLFQRQEVRKRTRIRRSNPWLQQISPNSRGPITFRRRRSPRYPKSWIRAALVAAPPGAIGHTWLLHAGAAGECKRHLFDLFLLDLRRGIAFNMYDSRGVAIAAERMEDLPDALVEELEGSVLDQSRETHGSGASYLSRYAALSPWPPVDWNELEQDGSIL